MFTTYYFYFYLSKNISPEFELTSRIMGVTPRLKNPQLRQGVTLANYGRNVVALGEPRQ